MNKILRLALVCCAAAAVAQPAWARQLTPREALERATGQQAPARLKAKSASVRTYSLVYQAAAEQAEEAEPMVYVFAGSNGFIVTPADDEFAPVLGYGDSGATDSDAIPEQMKWWLSEYAREMEYYLANASETATDRPVAVLADSKAPISPLCATKWNQDEPYNALCPSLDLTFTDGSTSSEPTVTGCVATAMAQVMKYYNWPDVGTGSHSYDWQAYSNSAKKTLSCDFSATPFNWNNMLNEYKSGSYTTAQGNAVAQLMYACGVSIEMKYNASRNGGSGASTYYVCEALKTYFKYSKSAHLIYRDDMSYAEWEDAIYAELAAKRPVLLSGGSSTGGHAFVCDGYAGDRYYHINWGWGGSSDGNFLLCRLNPQDQGIGSSTGGYNSGQDALCGVQPVRDGIDPATPVPASITVQYNLDYEHSNSKYYYCTTEIYNGSKFTGRFYNKGEETFSGNFGTIFTDVATGETVLETQTISIPSLESRYGIGDFPIVSSEVPADGTYYAFPAYWFEGETTAHRMSHGNEYIDRLVVKFANGAISSVSVPEMSDFAPELCALYLAVPDQVVLNTDARFSTTIVNSSGDTDYYGNISFCYAAKGSDTALGSDVMKFDVPAGLSIPFSFSRTFTDVSAGEYEGWFTDGSDRVISNRFPFTIAAASSSVKSAYQLLSFSPFNFSPGVSTAAQALIRNNDSSDTYSSQFIYTFTDRSNPSNVVTVMNPARGAYRAFDAVYTGGYTLSFDVQIDRTGIYDLVVSRRKYTLSGNYVTATDQYETISTPIKVTVGNNAESVTLSHSNVTLKVSDTHNLTATVLPEDALDKTVAWTSSHPEIVSVDNNGQLTALKAGAANIYAATMNGRHSVCAVSVQDTTGVEDIATDAADDTVTGVYNLNGIRVADSLNGLPCGLYIVTYSSGDTRKVAL